MKVSLKWLQEYVDIILPVNDLADRLTMAGMEVEGVWVIGGGWENVVVGQIIAITPHPSADRLSLATVELGTEQLTVVCGAPNLRIGDKVAFAHVGAQLVNGHSGQTSSLKSAKVRGVTSNGMVCSEKELGISDNHEGIMVLPAEAPVGNILADCLGDTIIDLEVTPNRPDCLSILGIAREIAALTDQKLHLPEVEYEESGSSLDQQISVEIAAPDLCPRYCASLITGVRIAESPKWMQQRLLSCGMRPINNIVDVTNYVMLEHGQPLHAFDYDRIEGRKIIVRRAADEETIVTLDGVERMLSEDMLVIADEERAVAIAGVMGGADSEVTEHTSSILLEAANFNPASIHHTGGTLRLSSAACMRFERGIRLELILPALKRATQLIVDMSGGQVASGLVDEYFGKLERAPIFLSVSDVKRLLGVEFSLEQIMRTLTSLGFDCKTSGSKSEIWVTAPYWRSDIHLVADLVEEVARIIGYDKIPATMLSQPLPRQNPDPIIGLKQKVKCSLTAFGFQEVITYSLIGLEMLNKLSFEPHPLKSVPLRVANPMTAEQEYLRPNLRANLLTALSTNRRHEDGVIRLFELGRVYLPRHNDLPDEPEVMCCVLTGHKLQKLWQGSDEVLDFFDAKGMIEGLLNQLEVSASFEQGTDESLHPARQAAVVIEGNKLGVVGELHTEVLEAFDISETAYLFEINVSALLQFTVGHKMFRPIPRFPATVRDIALVIDVKVSHHQILSIIKGFPLVSHVTVFDVYTGEQVPSGKKSLAYKIAYQSSAHTLTDEEVNDVQQQILSKLSQQLGATLRT